ncbi:MAG: 2-amino-4-hydroxy-6-hydroxymethyldihydropteridine diphosphokinase [Actinomycetota bacterium]|nr:2-amino-4-hydroxy-6-hydroxymethyldihydropteridine diphosphokinase [Actinomycetota bacterium]
MRGYLGLGSNEGDRLANLRAARECLAERLEVVGASSIYETAPQGEVHDQPDFLNAVLAIETELGPLELLDLCKEVERGLGRTPGATRHGPRPIDVDVLLLEKTTLQTERMTLPHPELGARRFVLEPLLEVMTALGEQRVERVGEL